MNTYEKLIEDSKYTTFAYVDLTPVDGGVMLESGRLSAKIEGQNDQLSSFVKELLHGDADIVAKDELLTKLESAIEYYKAVASVSGTNVVSAILLLECRKPEFCDEEGNTWRVIQSCVNIKATERIAF